MSLKTILKFGLFSLLAFCIVPVSCTKEEPIVTPDPEPDPEPDTTVVVAVEANIENLLINQINELIIPTAENYRAKIGDLLTATEAFFGDVNASNLEALKNAYSEAYMAYQATAVHNYYATANVDLVNTTNLYPVDLDLLGNLIENESYNFTTTAQQRANGFPAIDYLLYGQNDPVAGFSSDAKTATFLLELVKSMKGKADAVVDRWTGNLKENFIGNGGTELGSSLSVQLNQTMVYYEDHIRGNKVGLPIGRSGPNDTPFDPDPTIIEAYYQSLADGNEDMTLALVKTAIEEMEDIYLGTTATGEDGIGYEDLLLNRDQASLDSDIKATYQAIYDQIDNRSAILGDEELYDRIQALVTIYKSDLFPVLNIQDADGSNDGD